MQQVHETNWFVINPTTPANYFHALRRQILLPVRKPLVIMTPKSLLRLPEARSTFSEFSTGTRFRRVIPEEGPATQDPDQVERVVFCSGKVYYDLIKQRETMDLDKRVAIVRVEQLTPFPYDLCLEELQKYRKAAVIWAQEEHKNQGGFAYAQPRLETVLRKQGSDRIVGYAGRHCGASSATGNKQMHLIELAQLLRQAISLS